MIYIDISELLKVTFVTGIQRVVREIISGLLESACDVTLVRDTNGLFNIIDNTAFADYYFENNGHKSDMFTDNHITADEIPAGSIFFDIDSVWMSERYRKDLYPRLVCNGIKLVVFVHDIIPVTHPQFVHPNTDFLFLSYIGASIRYADLLIVTTEATRNDIIALCDDVDVPVPSIEVVPIGADYRTIAKESVRDLPVLRPHANKYVLMVGTVEPRKNHAYVLDAFENGLFEQDIDLVIAGRKGWSNEAFIECLNNHPQLNKQLFFITDANDAEIDVLYTNALALAFSSFQEGFGLPLIESMIHKTPVIASDIPVFREIGGEYCEYCDLNDSLTFISAVKKLKYNTEYYNELKVKLEDYQPPMWSATVEMIRASLAELTRIEIQYVPIMPKQMVVLTARPDDILNSLPFTERFMPFITEVVLCCPRRCIPEIKDKYNGRLNLVFLPDELLFNRKKLPEDHGVRNFLLRCLMVRRPEIDDVFIMSDDDYRPLKTITQETFISDGKYQAYYFYDIRNWSGDPIEKQSYDLLHFKTMEFLTDNAYPTLQYSSHMPQIIDKRIFNEMLDKHEDIELSGLDEWSSYFNYATRYYGALFDRKHYVTLGWPAYFSDWYPEYPQSEYLFENFYENLYDENKMFYGLSTGISDDITEENITKISRYAANQIHNSRIQGLQAGYNATYNVHFGSDPSFVIDFRDTKFPRLIIPQYLVIQSGFNWMRYRVYIAGANKRYHCELSSYYTTINGNELKDDFAFDFEVNQDTRSVELPITGLSIKGKYTYHCVLRVKENHGYQDAACTVFVV